VNFPNRLAGGLRPRGGNDLVRPWFSSSLKLLVLVCVACSLAGTVVGAELEQGELLSWEGKVHWAERGTNWAAATPGQKLHVFNRLRTLSLSRAMVKLAELGRVRLDELTTLEILPPHDPQAKATLDLKAGAMYWFSRERPRELLIQTPHALAASRGTEFLVSLDPAGRTVFTVFDGEVELSNAQGSVVLVSGEQGEAVPGQPPRRTAVLQARNIVQWWLYYPAVLEPGEAALSPAEQTVLSASLSAYREGDLLAALDAYPAGRVAASPAERLYHAALLLAVGRVDAAETELAQADRNAPLANALREMIAVVLQQPGGVQAGPETATEWLARSYREQSAFQLKAALTSARKATQKAPDFGFAWARVAELEFSFRQTDRAEEALARALELSPRNAQAWALKGFLASSKNHWREAEEAFGEAIRSGPGLGNGWLGRGLARIRKGEREPGRADLQTAAALEPNRSLLRSYLGKAFEGEGKTREAEKELHLARQLDDGDPTPWLYSALVLRQELRSQEAVAELERSVELNENRRVYRSRLLLDEDLAVRSASLASIYQEAGMRDVSVREAARAVASDYANASAHQFLAESFNALRDPTRFNLRIEPVWFNELLLANLLAPVGGGNLSTTVSQQEYSRFFETDRLGLSSFFEGRSDGQFHELASQFGTVGRFGYSLDLDFQRNEGVRPNNELTRIEWYSTAKYQLTSQDSLFFLAKYQDYHSGDNFQYYDPSQARTNFTFDEYQHPIAVLGYHREWSPGMHTLFLGGRLENEQQFSDRYVDELILSRGPGGQVVDVRTLPFDVTYQSVFEAFTAELNQICQFEHHLLVFGGRFQSGTFDTQDRLTLSPSVPAGFAPFFGNPPAAGAFTDDFKRISAYGYYTWSPADHLHLTGGAAYDSVTAPTGFRSPPVSGGDAKQELVSPKAALVWSPLPEMAVRAAYTRSLGGVTFDESFRLEPTQLAGFSQTFRNLISESVVGSVTAPEYETAGAALDLKFKTGTYVGFHAQALNSTVSEQVGAFSFSGAIPPPPPVTPSTTRKDLDYDEYSAGVGVNQLIARCWSLGANYLFTRSKLHTVYPEVPVVLSPQADRLEQADLQEATAFILFSHPSGFFARAETQWYHQDNAGYAPALKGDDVFMHNVFVGYRLRRQRATFSLGVLNLTGTDYRLNPLNPYFEMPRERVVVGRFAVNF
jgi:outer membrane receptor protein involved in Fe transport/Tfp pilus assembly protein PilF